MIRAKARIAVAAALALLTATQAAPPEPQALADRIDQHLSDRWAKETVKVEAAPNADDSEFLRRAYLDLCGRIPRAAEVRSFLADTSADKRRRLIDQLLDSPRHASHFAAVWRSALMPEAATRNDARFFQPGFEAWLRERFRDNGRYDQLVRDLIGVPIASDPRAPQAAMAKPESPNPLAFVAVKEGKPENLAAAATRLFLGIQIECAQCHDHPFAKWSREQFWNQAAFFAGVERQGDNLFAPLVEIAGRRDIAQPDRGKRIPALFLDGEKPKVSEKVGPRTALAEWITARDNPYFARAAVNRVWGQLMGIGIVEPVDDFHDDNPASHPALLDDLATHFVAADFDLRYLVRAICLSRAYNRTSARTHASQDDARLFARMAVKGLTGEQMFDSLALAIGHRDERGAFAPDRNSPRARFVERFAAQGKPSEPETSVAQALTLMNGRFLTDATSLDKSETLAAVVELPGLEMAQRIEILYLATLSRMPSDAERERLMRHVGADTRRLADVFWVLLNGAEFRLNH